MATDTAPDLTTLAGRVQAQGGLGLPDKVLTLLQQGEAKRRELLADARISDRYRAEQLAALDQEQEVQIAALETAEIAEAQKAAESRRAQIVGKIRAQFAHERPADVETLSEQAERHYRGTRDTLGLLPDMTAASNMTEPEDLLDALEESIRAEQHTRVRKLGPVIVARLAALMEQKHDGASTAWMSARTQLAAFKKAHPSLNAQLKAAEVELQHVAAPIQRKYRHALDYFKVGQSKHGMRIG